MKNCSRTIDGEELRMMLKQYSFLNIKKEVEKDFYDLIRIKIIKSTRENVRVYLRINNEILRFSTFRVGMKIVKRRQIFRRAFRSGR